jgi:DNA mismatch repair ATPase MutS
MKATETYTAEIELEDDILDVEFTGELTLENDGIGSYEYWGAKCYDEGTDYFELQSLEWDKTLYTEEQNQHIQSYIDAEENWRMIDEKMNESLFEKMEEGPDPDDDYDDRDYDREYGGVDW